MSLEGPSSSTMSPATKIKRVARACTNCQRLKVKCIPAEASSCVPCRHCSRTNATCIFEAPKREQRPRAPAGKALLCQLQRIEHTLDGLRGVVGSELHASCSSPHHERSPLPNIVTQHAESCSVSNIVPPVIEKADSSLDETWQDDHLPDSLDITALLDMDEIEMLFDIYLEKMNSQFGILQRGLHTPRLLVTRSELLLASVCAITARFYAAKPELHVKLTSLAKKWATSVLQSNHKSVEVVQAFLILTVWGYSGPADHCERDRTWVLLGIAIRIAIEINLHHSRNANMDIVQRRNHERTWLVCCIMDRSLSVQRGKPYSIIDSFQVDFNLEWANSPEASSEDFGLVSHWKLIQILTQSIETLQPDDEMSFDHPTTFNYMQFIMSIENQMKEWRRDWDTSRTHSSKKSSFLAVAQWFLHNLSLLMVNSFGLQYALQCSHVDYVAHFFIRCYTISMSCAVMIRDELEPNGYLKYGPDAYVILTSYAALTLLKLLRPTFSNFVDDRLKNKVYTIIADLANALESTAGNPQHLPALYGKFLRSLVPQHYAAPPTSEPIQQVGTVPTSIPAQQLGTSQAEEMLSMFDRSFTEPPDSQLFPVPQSDFNYDFLTDPSESGLALNDTVFGNSFWDSMFLPELGTASVEELAGAEAAQETYYW